MNFFKTTCLLSLLAFSSMIWASPLTDVLRGSIENRLEKSTAPTSLFENDGADIDQLHWNTNVWTHGLDLTGVAWWNSADGYYRRATLITPKHLLIVTHYSLSVGNEVAFLTKNNEVVRRTIVKKTTLMLPANRSG